MSERRIAALVDQPCKVYVWFKDNKTIERFSDDADAEGFKYADGVSLKNRLPQFRMAINPDRTVNYLGFAGHMAFDVADVVAGKKLIRVDYYRYVLGEKDYIIPKASD